MTMKKWLCVLCALLFLLAGCSQPQGGEGDSHGGDSSSQEESSPEENGRWEFDLPENHDMDPQRLQLLHEALADSSVYAMVTAKDGVIVDEFYQTGYDETSVFPLHSCSKSFTGALVGIAIQEGLLGGVDDLLSEYLPQVRELGDQGKGQITLRHLLTHTSGLEWYEWGGGASNWIEFQSSPNWVEYI